MRKNIKLWMLPEPIPPNLEIPVTQVLLLAIVDHLKGGQTLAYNKSEEQRKEKGKNFRRNKF